MQYVNCKAHALNILEKVKAVPNKKELWILAMGDDPASVSYMKGKIKDCEYCDIPYFHRIAKSESELFDLVSAGNGFACVGGIIVQLPLPELVNESRVLDKISPSKDVDGFRHDSSFKPCTPEGVVYVLKQELGNLTGKNALIIGKGKLVGRPLTQMLLDEGCTLTIAHSKTKDLDALLGTHDIVVSAVGKPNLVDLKKCKAEIVVDVGVNRVNGKLCGDCYNFDPDDGSDMKVTPVPGGIGLLTRAMLMQHVSMT